MKKKQLTDLDQKWFMLITFISLAIMLIIINYSYAQTNHAPVVSNVHIQQRPGTRLIDITYDVEDADGDLLEITVILSIDSGKTYSIIPKALTGDVGKNIKPGKGKKIVWDAKKDMPTAKGSGFKIRITADDGVKPEHPEEIIGKDGAPMVLIPASEFQMGSNDGDSDEKPVHTVYLDAFYIDKYEVTNAQYKKFTDATGHKAPAYWNNSNYNVMILNDPKQPVVGVTWDDAKAYADWAGERLPTEAEWEKAARGGLVGKKYPLGDTLTHDDANYSGTGGKDIWTYTSPVGSFAPNGYGLYDMAGNIWEWCADWYDSNYYANSPKSNPKELNSGSYRVLRGGSWYFRVTYYLRVAARLGVPAYGFDVGFRCVE